MSVTYHLSHGSWLQSSITTHKSLIDSLDLYLFHALSRTRKDPPPPLPPYPLSPPPAHLLLLESKSSRGANRLLHTMREQTWRGLARAFCRRRTDSSLLARTPTLHQKALRGEDPETWVAASQTQVNVYFCCRADSHFQE